MHIKITCVVSIDGFTHAFVGLERSTERNRLYFCQCLIYLISRSSACDQSHLERMALLMQFPGTFGQCCRNSFWGTYRRESSDSDCIPVTYDAGSFGCR